MNKWRPIVESHRDDGSEIVVRLKSHHPRMPSEFLGRSIHQIGTWLEGDLWVMGAKVDDGVIEGFMPLPQTSR
jgi:hypothetical protein